MIRLYVAGPMTGLPGLNFPAFNAAAVQLRAAGYFVLNPAEVKLPAHAEWADFMRIDLQLMLSCDGVALLEGWQASKGAKVEEHVAQALNMNVGTVAEHLAKAASWG